MLSRDVFRRFLRPGASDRAQTLFARLAIVVVTGLALSLATYDRETLLELGVLALPVAFQLWPALLGATWFPWITRQGALCGLGAGILAVILTESIGQTLTGGNLPWGRWPWTIHSAGWGMFFNLSICLIASAMSQDGASRLRRQGFHDVLHVHAAPRRTRRGVTTFAWIAVAVWVFFGAGPGGVIGNDIFGAPAAGYDAWDFSMPSLWAWRILWWGLGIGLIWFLAYGLEMSTSPKTPVAPSSDDVRRKPAPVWHRFRSESRATAAAIGSRSRGPLRKGPPARTADGSPLPLRGPRRGRMSDLQGRPNMKIVVARSRQPAAVSPAVTSARA